MSDMTMNIGSEHLSFDIEEYNQIVINDYETFFKFMIKLKEYEGEKFDEVYQKKYSGSMELYNEKQTKKNLEVIDLNDFSKIISNLTFSKESILKKYYISKINNEISEINIEEIMMKIEAEYKVDDKIKYQYKYPSKEKIMDLFLLPYLTEENEYLTNPNKIVELIINYLNQNQNLRLILVIDSSIKAFDYIKLINDSRIIIFDTSFDINNDSRNLLFVNENEINNVNMENLISKIELNWPIEITKDEIEIILKVYFRIIINDELYLFNKPSETLLCLYIIVRRSLGMELNLGNYELKGDSVSKFIQDNML